MWCGPKTCPLNDPHGDRCHMVICLNGGKEPIDMEDDEMSRLFTEDGEAQDLALEMASEIMVIVTDVNLASEKNVIQARADIARLIMSHL